MIKKIRSRLATMKKSEILNTEKIIARVLRSLFFGKGRLSQEGHFIQL